MTLDLDVFVGWTLPPPTQWGFLEKVTGFDRRPASILGTSCKGVVVTVGLMPGKKTAKRTAAANPLLHTTHFCVVGSLNSQRNRPPDSWNSSSAGSVHHPSSSAVQCTSHSRHLATLPRRATPTPPASANSSPCALAQQIQVISRLRDADGRCISSISSSEIRARLNFV